MKSSQSTQPLLAASHAAGIKLNQVKKSLRRRFAAEFGETLSPALLRRALDEAEQTAHETGFAPLVFPLLAEEVVQRLAFFTVAHEASGELASAA
jgi:AraC-like DNA-binding protein